MVLTHTQGEAKADAKRYIRKSRNGSTVTSVAAAAPDMNEMP